jgi:hypothetical protein
VYKGQQEVSVGLIAEEVEEVLPELVMYDKDGEILTVRYLDLIPILLQKVQECQSLKVEIRELFTQINDLNDLKKLFKL